MAITNDPRLEKTCNIFSFNKQKQKNKQQKKKNSSGNYQCLIDYS